MKRGELALVPELVQNKRTIVKLLQAYQEGFLTFSVLGQVGLNNHVKVGLLEDLKWEGSTDGYLNYFLAIVQTVI